MALSNWLTRDEWNAVFFAGLKAALDGAPCTDLGEQMRLGIGSLVKAGYEFVGISADADGNYEKQNQCCEGNETVLAEILGAYGGFDLFRRAQEALSFAKSAIPNLDFAWLEEALKGTKKEE